MILELDSAAAEELLDELEKLVDSIEVNIGGDFERCVHDDLWSDLDKAIDLLRSYGRRDKKGAA